MEALLAVFVGFAVVFAMGAVYHGCRAIYWSRRADYHYANLMELMRDWGDFPTNPRVGEKHKRWSYDGEKWVITQDSKFREE